jgi:hypothetical protein
MDSRHQGGGRRGEMTVGMTFMVSAFNPYNTLPVADEALDRGGVELLRAGLADEELHVTVRRAFEEPHQWGAVLADITLHLAALYSADGDLTKDNVIAIVAQGFAQSLGPVVKSSARGTAGPAKSTRPLGKAPAKKGKAPAKSKAKVKAPAKAKSSAKSASKAVAGRKGARR